MPILARSLFLLVVGLAPLLSGCTEVLTQGNPRPNIALIQQMKTLKLALGSDVPDGFSVENSGIKVQSWHGTLRNGFKNGFGGAYALVQGDANRVLTIDLAELGTAACVETVARGCLQIRYKATLSDSDGTTRRTAGSAESRYRTREVNTGEVPELIRNNVDSAVETMYEKIAKELFGDQAASPAK